MITKNKITNIFKLCTVKPKLVPPKFAKFKNLILDINNTITTMDKKTTTKKILESIRQQFQDIIPFVDEDRNWITVQQASTISDINRQSIYNLIEQNWFRTKKVQQEKREVLFIYKPDFDNYILHDKVVDELIKVGYYKEDIDQLTGKKRYLEVILDNRNSGFLKSEVKMLALRETMKKLISYFGEIDKDL